MSRAYGSGAPAWDDDARMTREDAWALALYPLAEPVRQSELWAVALGWLRQLAALRALALAGLCRSDRCEAVGRLTDSAAEVCPDRGPPVPAAGGHKCRRVVVALARGSP